MSTKISGTGLCCRVRCAQKYPAQDCVAGSGVHKNIRHGIVLPGQVCCVATGCGSVLMCQLVVPCPVKGRVLGKGLEKIPQYNKNVS